MSLAITIVSNPNASLVFNEADGVGVLKGSVNAALGGGSTAGVVKAIGSLEIDVSAQQLIDAGLVAAEAKYPAAAGAIAELKLVIDAEMAKN